MANVKSSDRRNVLPGATIRYQWDFPCGRKRGSVRVRRWVKGNISENEQKQN